MRDRPVVPLRHPGSEEFRNDPRSEVLRSLQRLAGNSAVTAWIGQASLQRDDAGTAVKPPTTATPTPTPAADPAADRNALGADAHSLKTDSGTATRPVQAQDLCFITFTGGR